MELSKEQVVERIVKRLAQEFKNGDLVNLGIGMPTKAVNYLPPGVKITLQSENGMLAMGKSQDPNTPNPRIVNAGGQQVTIEEGGMFFDSSFSFGLIRGGHVDITVLGGLEVDEKANLANWIVPGKLVPGMGGAMDLVNGTKKVIVIMEHCDKAGNSKIKKACTLPFTGVNCVDQIITELAVFEWRDGKLTLVELQEGVTVDDVKKATEADFAVAV